MGLLKFRLLDGRHPGIFAVTPFGEIPLLLFEDWESYKQVLDAMEGFYKEHHTEVPEVFKKAFGENGRG